MVDLTGVDLYHGVLPSHTKIDIWEEYARVVLRWMKPVDYSGLITADKPDLVDTVNDLGVEVTWSLPEGSKEIDALYSRLCIEEDFRRRSHIEDRLSKLGAKADECVCLHPTGHDDSLLIYKPMLDLR